MQTQIVKKYGRVSGFLNRFDNIGGVAGVSPARRGGEQRSASQGETSPSLKKIITHQDVNMNSVNQKKIDLTRYIMLIFQ